MSILHQFEGLLRDAYASRYLGAAGLVILLYDHISTITEEVALIWKAPPSWAKYGFLWNRYVVPTMLIINAYEMCGFSGHEFTDLLQVCRRLLFTSAMVAVCSISIANALVLMRVILLWENNPIARRLLTSGFIISMTATCIMMITTFLQLLGSIHYNSLAGMCVATKTSPILAGTWACPMAFEIIVLLATCWNAVDRPTHGAMPLIHALQRDGILYFLATTALRSVNLALAATCRPEFALLAVFFIWSMTTLVVNRSLLSLQKAEALNNLRIALDQLPRTAATPFGLPPEQRLRGVDFQTENVYEQLAELESSRQERASFTSSRWFGQ